jgi:ribosomal protein L32
MPPLPKKKHTRARKGNRNAHNAIKLPASSLCPCSRQERIQPHITCPECGNHKGRTMPGNWPQANLIEQVQPIAAASEDADS